MTNPKRHLRVEGTSRSACGLAQPRMWTYNPREVTCAGCRRTVEMADTEVKWRSRRR